MPKLNDGEWHHLVVTWTNQDGAWKVYLDRRLFDEGVDFQTGQVIRGGGVLVIGQEQDCLGGCFSISQEFLGLL